MGLENVDLKKIHSKLKGLDAQLAQLRGHL